MGQLQRRRFSDSGDVRPTGRGRVEVVELGDRVVGRETYEPGWRWSTDVKPIAGTPTCQFHHVGVTLSGRLRVVMHDGLELEVGPGEVFEIPPGHDAWVIGDEPWVSVDFEAMRGYGREGPDAGRRVLTSVLITDIVDSTGLAVAYGPVRWSEIVADHNQVAERTINEYGGLLVKTTGDGVLARFDSSERGARAAVQLSDAIRVLPVEIRAALHTGEVELSAGDVRGVVVHVAARMMATAGPGDVIVSNTVRDLLEGTSLEFENHGAHVLKGLPGQHQLYRLIRARMRPVPPAAAH